MPIRNAMRRPKEGLLVVVGSLLGAAIITGSFVVGDTMDSSIRQLARTHLGPIDEMVTSTTLAQGAVAARRLQPLRSDPAVDGLLTVHGDLAAVTNRAAGGNLEPSERRLLPRWSFCHAV